MGCGCGKKRINKVSNSKLKVKKAAAKQSSKKEGIKKRMIAIKAITNSTFSKK